MLAAVLTALCLAPTPRPVERLSPELVPGRWECRWGSTDAWFAFHADGTYLYGVRDEPSHVGRWEVRGGALLLAERPVFGHHEQAYEVTDLALGGYPTVTGRANGTTPVTLSNPRRFPEE